MSSGKLTGRSNKNIGIAATVKSSARALILSDATPLKSTNSALPNNKSVKFLPDENELKVLMSLMDTGGKGFISGDDLHRIKNLKESSLSISKGGSSA